MVLPVWRIHRHVGMGGDQLVKALAGPEVEEAQGDGIRAAEQRLYGEPIDEVEPFDGAHELIAELKQRGRLVVLASSAKQEELDRYREPGGRRDRVRVDRSSPRAARRDAAGLTVTSCG